MLTTSSPSQYECAAFIIDTWMDSVAQGRTNIAPSKIPWALIRTLITETYGGKVDDESDLNQLSTLVDRFLTPAAFDDEHKLVEDTPSIVIDAESQIGEGGLLVPGGTQIKDFMEWVTRLPEREPPTYLGLPANAEKLLLVGHGQQTIQNFARIIKILEEGEQLEADEGTY